MTRYWFGWRPPIVKKLPPKKAEGETYRDRITLVKVHWLYRPEIPMITREMSKEELAEHRRLNVKLVQTDKLRLIHHLKKETA